MAEQSTSGRDDAGPGSRIMAAALLEMLTHRGRLSDRERAARAVGLEDDRLVDAPLWLDVDAMTRMLSAGRIEAPVARALGLQLVRPDAVGLTLYALGMATPEKAYRRVQSLLPREAPTAKWLTERIKGECAWLSYRPQPISSGPSKVDQTLGGKASACALRRGMLEAIPTLYGLLPATVHDEQCVARGDSICRYRVEWQRSSHRGFRAGIGIGIGLAASLLVVANLALGMGLLNAGALLTAALLLVCAAAIGRVVDLVAQLDAVGGTRRGQLALFEQVDDQLATKLDALARVDAKLEEEPTSFRVNLGHVESESAERVGDSNESEPSERERGILAAAQAIHQAAGDLECWFDAEAQKVATKAGRAGGIGTERGQVREIRDWAVRIADQIAPEVRTHRTLDLASLVERGIASVRPLLPANAVIRLEVDDDLEPVTCEPVQIEQVVIQLVRNAIEASEAIMDVPEAMVTLRNARAGVELAVEDRGAGIESTAVDEVFDPFFGEAPLGTAGGFGLPICLRIVQAHGGELRIEAEGRAGTCVCVFLPRDPSVSTETLSPSATR